MATPDELNGLFQSAATLAEDVVRQAKRDFTPWVTVLGPEGKKVDVLCPATSAEEAANPHQRVVDLARGMFTEANAKAAAIVFDSRFRMQADGPAQDAIQIELMTPEGLVGRFLRPYTRNTDGVVFGKWAKISTK
jgi:hypothetical protein